MGELWSAGINLLICTLWVELMTDEAVGLVETPGIIEWHQIDKGRFYTLGMHACIAAASRCTRPLYFTFLRRID